MMAAIIKDHYFWISIKLTTDGKGRTPFDQDIQNVLFRMCEVSVRLAFINPFR
jgi:hypothetical protein